MTLRPEIVRERLHKLREVVRNLRELADLDESEFRRSFHHYWTGERGLQLAAETVFDVGTHILAGQFNDHPDTYEAIIEQLGVHGVITDDLQQRLTGLGGFRNILVHGYLEVDRSEVFSMIQHRLDDFIDFADQIDRFLEQV